ncbi:MAG: phosphotransferase [Iphinoe sp. HA4291-MV1]|jgi:hypothetical protein|nr:phosphotransferase [Iphinoe sp. HA4291-MV1]
MPKILFIGQRECVLPNSDLNDIIKTLYPYSNYITLHVQQKTYNNQVIEFYPHDNLKPEAYLKIFLRKGKLVSNPGEIVNTFRHSQGGFSLAPKVLCFDSRNYFYLVTQRMNGCQGNLLNLSLGQLLMVEQAVQTLHSHFSTDWGPFGKCRHSYSSFEVNQLLGVLKRVGIVLEDKAISVWLTRLAHIEQFSFCHGECILEHLIIDTNNIRLIDWEASGYNHPFVDWSAWIHSLLIYGYYVEAKRLILALEKNDNAKLLPFFFAKRLLHSIAYPRNHRIIDPKTQQAYLCCAQKILAAAHHQQQLDAAIEFIHEHASRLRE